MPGVLTPIALLKSRPPRYTVCSAPIRRSAVIWVNTWRPGPTMPLGSRLARLFAGTVRVVPPGGPLANRKVTWTVAGSPLGLSSAIWVVLPGVVSPPAKYQVDCATSVTSIVVVATPLLEAPVAVSVLAPDSALVGIAKLAANAPFGAATICRGWLASASPLSARLIGSSGPNPCPLTVTMLPGMPLPGLAAMLPPKASTVRVVPARSPLLVPMARTG